MIDSFWLAVASGCVVLAVGGIFVVLWWSIRQNIANMSEAMKGLATTLARLENDFGIKISELQREAAKEQKEMEARFTAARSEADSRFYDAIKESNDRFLGYNARVSEVTEMVLRQEANMYKEFMPKDEFKETFSGFRSEITKAVEKVEHQLEKGLEKIDKSLQTRA